MRTSPWTTLVGALLLLVGLNRDARMHAQDPTLAAREGVFTLANPAHGLFAAGLALVVLGTLFFLAANVVRQASTPRGIRWISGVMAGLLVLLSLGTFTTAVRGSGHDARHDHGMAPAQVGMGMPADATPAQRLAAEELLAEVRAGAQRLADVQVAVAEGYRQTTPYRFGRWGPAHFTNPAYRRDGQMLDPSRPESLVYMKLPDSRIVLLGVMFTAPSGEGPRPGGPITVWHVHDNLCLTATGTVARPAGPGQCPEGAFFVGAIVEMMHIWTFDNPDGPYAQSLSRQAIAAAVKEFAGRR